MRRPADRTSAGFDRVSYWASVLRSSHACLRFSSRPAAWAAFWNGIAEDYETSIQEVSDFTMAVVGHLLREGLLDRQTRVLDIGCGPGTFTLPLASHVRHVLAVDPSYEMVNRLEARMRTEGAENITTAVAAWNDFLPSPCDVVFSAFCPALFTPRSLCKMHRSAGKTAIIISFTGYRLIGEADGLWRKIMGTPPLRPPSAIAVLNYLFAKGLRPGMRTLTYEMTRRVTEESLVSKYELLFSVFTRLTPDHRKCIRDEVRLLMKRKGDVRHVKQHAVVIWWNREGA